MKEVVERYWLLLLFTVTYILGFGTYFFMHRNFEFILYLGIIIVFFFLVLMTLERSLLNPFLLWGLSIWGLLHVAGGTLMVQGSVLYNWHIVTLIDHGEFFLLRFDQVVHFYGFFIATLVGFHLMVPQLKKDYNLLVVYSLAVCVGIGLGALNEVAEFIAVITVPQTNVGGYYNTGLDLIFNLLGALCAALFYHVTKGKWVLPTER